MPASHSGKGFGNARTSAVKGQNRPSSCIASGIWCIFVYLCCKKCGNEIINVPKTKEDKKCILPSQNVRSRPLTILLWLSVLPDKKSCPEEEEAKYCILHWQQPQKTMMQYSQNTSCVLSNGHNSSHVFPSGNCYNHAHLHYHHCLSTPTYKQ